ncbi:hypothetical protein AX767_00425 [Variovorax sp. PAMC 28711]|nr:hypothetical protein AX767_00425 [Variovorax sp. PAMC 28711]
MVCAVGWAYAATAAVITEHLVLVGPCAVGFIAALFTAQGCEPLDGKGVGGFEHAPIELFLPKPTRQNRSRNLRSAD